VQLGGALAKQVNSQIMNLIASQFSHAFALPGTSMVGRLGKQPSMGADVLQLDYGGQWLVREIRVTAATGILRTPNGPSAQGSGCNRFTNRGTLRAPSVLYLTTVYSKNMFSFWKKKDLPSEAIYPSRWSVHTPGPPFGQLPSPFNLHGHTLSTSATSAGELFLFGGLGPRSSKSNDLYVISSRDFSTTPFKTSGDVPNPRYGHCAVLTSTFLLIWGGMTNFGEKAPDDSLYVLNLGTSDLFDVKDCSS